MVTVSDNHYTSTLSTTTATVNGDSKLFSDELLANFMKTANMLKNSANNNDNYIDIPLLVSDEDGLSDDEVSSQKSSKFVENTTAKEIGEFEDPTGGINEDITSTKPDGKTISENSNRAFEVEASKSFESFRSQKDQLMKIIVEYIAAKITNSFPPENPKLENNNELPLDKFLLILTSRLQLTMLQFMTGIIYLFRYMDIIYLLRYLNQSNNFANYNEMGFCLKKLIIGCFKLALTRANIQKNWPLVTGLPNNEINKIVRAIVTRMNGKLVVKDIELIKLKSEIFRFVNMVTKTV